MFSKENQGIPESGKPRADSIPQRWEWPMTSLPGAQNPEATLSAGGIQMMRADEVTQCVLLPA